MAYHWAIFFNNKELKAACQCIISAESKAIFESDGFLSSEHVVLCHILQIDTLNCEESVVLKACLDWARRKCEHDDLDASKMKNLKIYLMDALYNIRFASLTSVEIGEFIGQYGSLFTDSKHYEEIFRIHARCEVKSDRFNPKPRLAYSYTIRHD